LLRKNRKGVANMKEDFIQAVNEIENLSAITVAVRLPSGAIEVITNMQDLDNKAKFYRDTYDEDFRHNHNKEIQIVGFMVV
jgi:hypothetical protein